MADENNAMGKNNVVGEELLKFLVRAKKATYASKQESAKVLLVDGGKELVFEEGGIKYRDRYYGFNPFIGEEILFKKGTPV